MCKRKCAEMVIKMQKILSIVIPAYNVEKYLPRCLESFALEEILDDIEVLIINDGSKDGTQAIAQSYCEKYPNTYFLYNKENGGHGSGINYGIRYAKGNYFKVVDGDDWLNEKELPAFVELLKKSSADVVAADYLCIRDGTDEILQKKHCTPYKKQYGTMVNMHNAADVVKMHALTIKTEILQKNNIHIDEHCYYVDCEYITYPMPYVKTIYYYPKFLYMYRLGRNGQSMDIKSMQKNRLQHQKVLDSLLKFYHNLEETPYGTKHYIERCIGQVVENQFQIYISMGFQKGIQKELRQWDKQLKVQYPEIYAAVQKKSIQMLRKTNYIILPIGTMVYRILK